MFLSRFSTDLLIVFFMYFVSIPSSCNVFIRFSYSLEKTTKINELIGHLLKPNGKYIGVTATPARLDLNNTFDNKKRLI
jgi:hypothetical protein